MVVVFFVFGILFSHDLWSFPQQEKRMSRYLPYLVGGACVGLPIGDLMYRVTEAQWFSAHYPKYKIVSSDEKVLREQVIKEMVREGRGYDYLTFKRRGQLCYRKSDGESGFIDMTGPFCSSSKKMYR